MVNLKTNARKIFTIILLVSVDVAHAMTPGASIAHWKPEVVPGLNSREIRDLQSADCLVTSYRSGDVPDYTKNTSGKPDELDELTLARGEFAVKGQQDMVVLCMSSRNKEEFFYVVWGGTVHCSNQLLMSKVSRFMKRRDPQWDYYGSRIEKNSPSEAKSLIRKLGDINQPDTRKENGIIVRKSEMGEAHYWLPENIPEFEHDSIWFFGSYGFSYYCDGKNWIKLYDYFSTEID
ncbi:MAG: hypothetical protein OEV23_09530 [Gallionella sp.]|nr:hypothetical protein [Gallionella sp.]